MVRSRPLKRLHGWCAPLAAALVGGAVIAACLPAAGAADTASELRARAEQLRRGQDQLQRTEHGALLALFAAEATLGRARADQARLAARSRSLAIAAESLRRRAQVVQRSLVTSQRRVVSTLRALYIDGEGDPIAALLGASSLDEALTAIDSFERAATQNERLVAEARSRARKLAGLRAELDRRRARLDDARAAAAAASARLARVASEQRATVAGIRSRNARAAARLDALVAQARTAEQTVERLTDSAAGAAETTAATAAPAEDVAAGPSAAVGTRTLVVDAVAYHLPGHTTSGLPVGMGVVAVDPGVIPLGTRLFIPGYGPGIAADTGSAVRGNIIDLWMPSNAAARRWGRRTVTITIYG